MRVYQQILRGPRSSNRGIRYRRLRPSEVDDLLVHVARLVAGYTNTSPEERAQRSHTLNRREGVKRMLVAVTKNPVPVPQPVAMLDASGAPMKDANGVDMMRAGDEPTLVDDALWQKVDVQTLSTDEKWAYDEIFEAPDDDFLARLYAYNHEASATTVESIVKKELKVSTD